MAILLLVGVLIIAGIVGGVYYLGLQKNTNTRLETKNSLNDTNVVLPQAKQESQQPKVPSGSVLFESKKLGIRLFHAKSLDDITEKQDRIEIKTLERGNKIYVYQDLEVFRPEDGQYVEVFEKDRKISLKEAIEQQFLKGYSANDCYVEEGTGIGSDNVLTATIRYTKGLLNEDPSSSPNICPTDYAETMGIRYFFMFKNYPSKFGFLSIGHYSLPAESGKDMSAWQETIEFFD